jgi:hypothetical protein
MLFNFTTHLADVAVIKRCISANDRIRNAIRAAIRKIICELEFKG